MADEPHELHIPKGDPAVDIATIEVRRGDEDDEWLLGVRERPDRIELRDWRVAGFQPEPDGALTYSISRNLVTRDALGQPEYSYQALRHRSPGQGVPTVLGIDSQDPMDASSAEEALAFSIEALTEALAALGCGVSFVRTG